MFRRLLVPIDGSALSDAAVDKAVTFAREANATITFFFAKPDADASIYGEAEVLRVADPVAFEDVRDRRANGILARAVAVAGRAGVVCDAHSTVATEPYVAIIAAAEVCGCDLILMASHGRRGVKGLLLGSQTQKVLTYSRFPVLVYR